MIDTVFQDLKFAIRMLRKSPGFALLAIITLALGIGANTAVFSLVDAVLLRPLPFPESNRLMAVILADPKEVRTGSISFGNADFIAFRDQQKSFSHVAAYSGGLGGFSYTSGGEAHRVRGVAVTADFFRTLGVTPERGRGFQPEDDRLEAQPVVMLSHDFWQTQLGSDPEIIGKSINLNGQPQIVVGVMRPGVRFPSNEPVDVWPLRRIAPSGGRPPYYLAVFGRLKPDVSPEQAAQELSAISQGVGQAYPGSSSWVGRVEPLKAVMTKRVRTALWVLLAAVAFVLLIALVNVANLLLVRATARQKEIGIRVALGASRARIIGQLVTESLLLAATGGIIGVLLTVWAQRAFVSLNSTIRIPLAYQAEIDSRVLLFTLGISVLSGVIFGLAPALHGAADSLHNVIRDAARSTASGVGLGMRRILIAVEFSLALVLVAGAALLIRSFVQLQQVDPGFNPDNILTAQITLPPGLYRDEKSIASFWDEFLRRANGLPGVQSVSLTLSVPPDQLALTNPFTAEGQPYDRSRPLQLAEEVSVGTGYFGTLGVPILSGRDFNDSDRTSTLQPIIINRALAQKSFPGQDPNGRHLQTGDPRPDPPTETIIGVVGDVKYSGLDAPPSPQAYKLYSTPGWTSFSRAMYLVVRTSAPPSTVSGGLRRELASLDPNIPLVDVMTMRERLGESVGEQRFRTLLLGSFAGFALLLACIGLYAVMSYSVGQRTREIGIRMALGSRPREILVLVIRQALTLSCIGIAAGIVAALILTRMMRTLLFGITPADPLSFIVSLVLLTAVALLASYIPARRATKVDPMVALRYE
jgi:putative ABC transport system permease protein